MDFGIVLPNYGVAASVESIISVAKLAEELNFNSIWVTDHIVVPEEFDNPYGNLFEIIVTLSYLAAITNRIKLGTSITILPIREPNLVAKQLATLDVLSNGRVIFGVGGGWMKGEYEKIGVNFSDRGTIFDDNIKKIRQFWQGFDKFVSKPGPLQKNGPKIIVGGNSKRARIRAKNLGDGWFPVGLSPDELKKAVKDFPSQTEKKNFPVHMRSLVEITDNPIGRYVGAEGKTRYSISGSSDEIIAELNKFEGNLESLVCYFGNKKKEDLIKQIKKFAKEVMPSF